MSLAFAKMQHSDLQEVQDIESQVYPYPWTERNFLDSLYQAHENWIARDESGALLGYFVVMLAVDEAHLLNITVRGDLHGQGIGRLLLDKVMSLSREKGMASVLLEVRPSNTRALAMYEHDGFMRIGVRRAYYPAPANAREDAIVMRLAL